jgi:peptide/nickel transport system substrate-binding protein
VQRFTVFVNQGVAETDPARRAAIYKQFNRAYYDAAPTILLAVQQSRLYTQRWVQGYYYNPIYPGYYFCALSKK